MVSVQDGAECMRVSSAADTPGVGEPRLTQQRAKVKS